MWRNLAKRSVLLIKRSVIFMALVAAGWSPYRSLAQQAGGPQAGGPQVAGPQATGQRPAQNVLQTVPVAPQAPFQITPEHQAYVDKLLSYWEERSQQIERYRCEFTRWEYDFSFGPKKINPQTGEPFPKTVETGEIKYVAPDKGLFKVVDIMHARPKQINGQPSDELDYVRIEGEQGEHWVCDGESVFEFISEQKVLREQKLPAEMHGKAITDGPLPFLFGAEAAKIKARYWVRVVTPAQLKEEYWLEAWPKRREDAANFLKVLVLLDMKEFLPYAIRIFPRTYKPGTDESNTTFQFKDRKINETKLFAWNEFKPSPPAGWKKEVQDFSKASPDASRQNVRSAQAPGRLVNPFRSFFSRGTQRH